MMQSGQTVLKRNLFKGFLLDAMTTRVPHGNTFLTTFVELHAWYIPAKFLVVFKLVCVLKKEKSFQ